MDSKRRHIYEKLPLPARKSTRLLTIVPGSCKDTIECTLEVVDLDEKPDYVALSYMWNPPDLRDSPPVRIICNGVSIEVTPNLGAAVKRFRRPRVTGMSFEVRQLLSSRKHRSSNALKPGRRIWIDALCINQEDLAERSSQVSFMGYLYSAAENVIVWLGEDPGYGSKAMSLIRKVSKVAEKEGNYQQYEQVTQRRKELPLSTRKFCNLMFLFFSNPWFRRVWIIQEVARETALMILGRHEISLLDVSRCSTWINAKTYVSANLKTQNALASSQCIYRLRFGASFSLALAIASPMEATDPRGKIYALLGVHSNWANRKGTPPRMFIPDYGKPVPLLYTEFIRYFLALPRLLEHQEGSLRIILRHQGMTEDGHFMEPEETEDDAKFPSWVPCWDQCRPPWSGLLVLCGYPHLERMS
jgi:hypothetical protein